MNYRNPELVDHLAGGYALGTLQGPARRRFKTLRSRFAHIDDATSFWEGTLADLALKLTPIPPPDHVWPRITAQIDPAKKAARRAASPWLATAAAFVIAIALTLSIYKPGEQMPLVVAVVQNQQEQALWRIQVTDVIKVKHVSAEPLPDNKVYQLWFKVGDGVVSLGLLPQAGEASFRIKESLQPLLKMGGTIGVSIEPQGGSPLITKPSGPVIAHAQLVAG